MESAGEENPLQRRHLREDLAIFWKCYLELNKTRRIGFDGPERISCGAVEDWFRVHGYTDRQLILDAWEIVHRLDDERADLIKELREESNEETAVNPNAKGAKNANA